MTATMVTQVNTYQEISSSVKTGTSNSKSNDFSKVFEKNASQNTYEPNKKVDSKNDDVKSKTEELNSDFKTDNSSGTEESKKTGKVESLDKKEAVEGENVTDENLDIDKMMDEAYKKVDEILLAIQNLLNIPTDQITDMLENLDMQPTDLLEASNIPKLVLALTDGADEFTLMTDEKLFAQVKDLMNLSDKQLTSLSEDFGISAEELKIQIHTSQINQSEVTENNELSINIKSNETTNQLPNQEHLTDKANNDNSTIIKTEGKSSNQETKNEHNSSQEFTFSQSVMQELKDAVSRLQNTKPVSYVSETDSIMDQISEMLKVTMKDDMTELEMQLHPASLGNVRVQVASKDGIITASFTTQNETVKAALESQIITLKESLTEQGIKVEAVEVTVASHAFERNLNEEGEQSSGQMQEKKKSVRKINLADLSDDSDEGSLEQQDIIVADMMRKNGNTVDYTA